MNDVKYNCHLPVFAFSVMQVAVRKQAIYKLLEDTNVKTIVLHGDPGVGKTWTAREVSNYARRKLENNGQPEQLFDFVLWVYLNRQYDDASLRTSILQQLSLLPTRGISEVEEDDEKLKKEDEPNEEEDKPNKEEEPNKEEDRKKKEEERKKKKQERKKKEADEQKKKEEDLKKKEEELKKGFIKKKKNKFLIVLDDEGDKKDGKMNEKDIRKMLDKLFDELFDKKLKVSYRVLITTRTIPNDTTNNVERRYYEVMPMEVEESLVLFKKRAFSDHKPEVLDALAKEFLKKPNLITSAIAKKEDESLISFMERAFSDHKAEVLDHLAKQFLKKTKYIPSAIVMMAKAFKYFCNKEKESVALLKRFFEEPDDGKIYNITDLLRSGYDLVPFVILIDCQRDATDRERQFLSDTRCINHNELIAYWIMEGYLGHVTCMDTAYRRGHEILMELFDFQILKRAEADYVRINPLGEEFDEYILRWESEYYRRGYFSHARLGLDSVFVNVGRKDLVRISHKGSVMRTLPGGKGQKEASVLILDGNSLGKNLPSKFSRKLQFLAIFNPTLDMLSPFKKETIEQLHVFVLRNCRFLKDLKRMQGIKKYENLTVLEISGPVDSSENVEISDSFTKFPDDFFERMPKLQSLNFSSLPITILPSSLSKLLELKWLILRDCTELTTLNSLKDCTNLLVLDCSGSKSLETLQDRSFLNTHLEVINLSRTKIKILPLIRNLKKLTHLLLSGCSSLNRMRSIKDVASLEVIDLSNSGDFNEFFDKSLDKLENLKVLDISGTGVSTLPSSIGKPRQLFLENCTKLSGARTPECLEKFKDLERFVLSNTGIQSLPSTFNHTNLRQLSVTRCLYFEEVPDLTSFEKMEDLDFSGCEKIKSIPANAFSKMNLLQKLNLCGTGIEILPSLVNLSDLRYLLIKDCKELKTLPSLESKSLEKLEEINASGCKSLEKIDDNFFDGTVNLHILDLSDTWLDKLPSFSKLKTLLELRLRNCKGLKIVPDLETLTTLEILDLSGTAVSDLPFSDLPFTKLRELMLNNCSFLSEFQKKGTVNVLGGPIQDLPYGISGLTSLERLDLPNMDDFQGEKPDGCQWGISSFSVPKENRPSVSVGVTQFLQTLEKDPSSWEKFHLCVYPFKELDANSSLHFRGDDFVYRDIYLKIRNIDDQRLLDVFGFTGYKPEGINAVFSYANQVFFVDNKFQVREKKEKEITQTLAYQGRTPPKEKEEEEEIIIQTLPSFLSACNSEQIKGCWIEKCKEIEVVFGEKEFDKVIGLLNSVETLSISNATSLDSIFDIPKEIAKDEVFKKLKNIYLEYCPELSTVFYLSHIPEKLKTLQIKYCDKLAKVFGQKPDKKVPDTVTSTDQKSDDKVSAARTSKDKKSDDKDSAATAGTTKGKKSDDELSATVNSNDQKSDASLSASGTSGDQISVDKEHTLQFVKTLHLWELPELESIGCQLPSLKTLKISNCPKLQKMEETIGSAESLQNLSISNVRNLKTIRVSKELKYLTIVSCPDLVEIITSSQPPRDLEIRIRFCNKLETLFKKGTSSEIKVLHLHGLPKLKSIGATSLPNQANRLITDCLNLKSDV